MRVPQLIVPDSKPPVLLMSLGATLLAGFVIRALRRRHRRAATSVVNSTGWSAPRTSRSRTAVYER